MERLVNQYNTLIQAPIEGITVELGSDFQHWQGVIIGPPDTPFENGRFHYELIFPTNYPINPPDFYIKTTIFHPNVDEDGKVCCSLIGSDWKPNTTIRSVFYGICALFNQPNKENGYLNEAVETLIQNKSEFERKAREWTRRFAL